MLSPPAAMAEAIPVELQQTAQGWQLSRDGEPYFIRGAGGEASLDSWLRPARIRSAPGAPTTSARVSTRRTPSVCP